MLIVFTGDGKGKTTAALGQAMRAVGNGRTVLMVQFIKGPWKSGEDESHRNMSPALKIVKKGKGFVGLGRSPYTLKEHSAAAQNGLQYAINQSKRGKWDIIILDEIWNTLDLRLLTKTDILSFINQCVSEHEYIIMTGRSCPQEFIEIADLVTEMKSVKHPFDKDVKAAAGLEF